MILIIGAMVSETIQIESIIDNKRYFTIGNKAMVSGQIGKQNVLLATSGVGKANAAMTLSSILSTEPIDSIINVGLVGGFKPLKQNDIVLIESATYHDFDLTIFGYEMGQVPNMPQAFKSDQVLFERISSKLNMSHVRLYTGDCFLQQMIETNSVCDMEGAALYQVAYLFNKPIIAIKLVSDVVGEASQIEDYEQFERQASKQLKEIIEQVLA